MREKMPQQNPNKKTKSEAEAAAFADALRQDMQRNGPMTVADYMGRVAQHYYAHAVPFGVEGDFTTAPEISQMFGEMIAAWCVDLWHQAGKPSKVNLVELGPGRGTLMADMLRIAKSWPDFAAAVSVHLVETSPQLRLVQADNLHAATPVWHDSIDSLPDGFSLMVANEFFDALPIHQFVKKRGVWLERAVDFDAEENTFCFATLPLQMDLAAVMPADFMNAPDGSFFEISPVSLDIAGKLAQKIAAHHGACLIIDYGHARAGLGDTLQSIARHAYADVLEAPGMRDITAHVDFATLAHACRAHADIHGPVAQGQFLNALGIVMRAEKLAAKATPKQRQQIMTDLHRLTAPSVMGDLFKVMCITAKNSGLQPAGLQTGDGV
jgi:NADH dehydrogenase [ubiquinone] 1 alpha subcomplex assembly factor 7